MGANPELSWLGVLGYSGASAFPAILICFLGPKIRDMCSEDAFCTTDFGRKRYGRVMQVVIALVSIFYMFIYIVAELTSISNVYALVTNTYSETYGIIVTVVLGGFTLFYTGLAGLPASIVTDKFQALLMALLVILLTLAVAVEPENRVTRQEWDLASNWTGEGAMAAVTLVIAIACAEMFNQGTWQRVWAAESVRAMRVGFLLASVLVFLLMMFFGIMGMLAYALDPEAYDSFEKLSFLAFFDLLEPLANGWHIVILILVTALAASSVDSLQTGLTCIFSHDLVKIGWSPKWISRILVVLLNVPAIYLASEKYDVISLFLVADLVCATSVFPTFLGLQTKDMGFLKAPTELGAFLGCVSGVATVIINGIINDTGAGVFEYFWLRNDAICSLCGAKTMTSFIVTPAVSAIMTYIFSAIDIKVRGERARQPIISLGFDDDDRKKDKTMYNSSEEEEEEVGQEVVYPDPYRHYDVDDQSEWVDGSQIVHHDGSVYASDLKPTPTLAPSTVAS